MADQVATWELHVWGPAFGLASLDAECLATIVYFSQVLSPSQCTLVQSSRSAVPTGHLPALRHVPTNTWTGGFSAIVGVVEAGVTPWIQTPSQRADATAYMAYLSSHAAPLLALYLYVSWANWSDTTRPAYNHVLPFPLGWTEPLVVRAAMTRRAAHLGLDSLDVAEVEANGGPTGAPTTPAAAEGWGGAGAALGRGVRNLSVRAALTPEHKASIRLDALAADVLDVIVDSLRRGVLASPVNRLHTASPYSCLAYAYLALMMVPDVPRPWLRNAIRTRYAGLCSFTRLFGVFINVRITALPWMKGAATRVDTVLAVKKRFLSGLMHKLPGVSEDLQRRSRSSSPGLFEILLGVATVGTALVAWKTGILVGDFWRGLPLHRWQAPPRSTLRLPGPSGLFWL